MPSGLALTLGPPVALLLAVFPAGVIVAALKDATSFTIPNWLSAALALAFFPVALMVRLPIDAAVVCLASAGIALLCGMGMFAMGWCGGGDAKLMTACALWLGWPGGLTFILATGIAGGLLAAGLIAVRKASVGMMIAAGPGWLGRLFRENGDLPYGLAIAVGALAAFPASPLLAQIGRF